MGLFFLCCSFCYSGSVRLSSVLKYIKQLFRTECLFFLIILYYTFVLLLLLLIESWIECVTHIHQSNTMCAPTCYSLFFFVRLLILSKSTAKNNNNETVFNGHRSGRVRERERESDDDDEKIRKITKPNNQQWARIFTHARTFEKKRSVKHKVTHHNNGTSSATEPKHTHTKRNLSFQLFTCNINIDLFSYRCFVDCCRSFKALDKGDDDDGDGVYDD